MDQHQFRVIVLGLKPMKFAGLTLDRPVVMGIVNVTPDSFYDGGRYFSPDSAIAHGIKLAEDGADIIDIGGVSTRPGACVVSEEDELARVLPVIAGLSSIGIPLSVDTSRATVMRAAVEAGAGIINDITALTGDEDSLDVVNKMGVPVILMHMQGEPSNMQKNPLYSDVVAEVFNFLLDRVAILENFGIPKSQIAIDPGIGFGKSLIHNIKILNSLDIFSQIGCAVTLGVSRKSFVNLSREKAEVDNRIGGSLAAALAGIKRGVNVLRVHDVFETCQALSIWSAIEFDTY